MRFPAVILHSLILSAPATFAEPSGCKDRVAKFTAKIEKINADSRAEIENVVEAIIQNLKDGELEKVKSLCAEVVKAEELADDAGEAERKELRAKARTKARVLKHFLEELFFRDRATWDKLVKPLEEKGYNITSGKLDFVLIFTRDLVPPKSGRGTQRLVKTLALCEPSDAKIGSYSTKIRVSPKDAPGFLESDYISPAQFAQSHVIKECKYETDPDHGYLQIHGALLETPSAQDTSAEPAKGLKN